MEKSSRTFQRIIIILLIIILSACMPEVKLPESSVPTAVNTVVSPSSYISLSPTPFVAQTPTQVLIGLPTMPAEKQRELYELFKNNGGCELPCFVGITPGKSSWSDTKVFFEEFTAYPFPDTPNLRLFYGNIFTNQDVFLNSDLNIYINSKDVLEHLVYQVEITKNDVTETHDEHLAWYSITNIFKRYGQPDSAYLSVQYNGVYSIIIVYEKKKAALMYGGFASQIENGENEICPNLGDGEISSMALVVMDPLSDKDFNEIPDFPSLQKISSLEAASGLSVDEYYDLITDSEKPVCLPILIP